MIPSSILIDGDLADASPEDLRESVEAARNCGVQEIYLRVEDPELESAAEDVEAEPLPRGRRELAEASVRLLERVESGELEPEELDEERVEEELEAPEVDAVVMVSSDRLSDGAIWGAAYAEYFQVEGLDADAVESVVEEFEERSRRFGR